jgi:hypothetical protein
LLVLVSTLLLSLDPDFGSPVIQYVGISAEDAISKQHAVTQGSPQPVAIHPEADFVAGYPRVDLLGGDGQSCGFGRQLRSFYHEWQTNADCSGFM